jgi:hypothetical protein
VTGSDDEDNAQSETHPGGIDFYNNHAVFKGQNGNYQTQNSGLQITGLSKRVSEAQVGFREAVNAEKSGLYQPGQIKPVKPLHQHINLGVQKPM